MSMSSQSSASSQTQGAVESKETAAIPSDMSEQVKRQNELLLKSKNSIKQRGYDLITLYTGRIVLYPDETRWAPVRNVVIPNVKTENDFIAFFSQIMYRMVHAYASKKQIESVLGYTMLFLEVRILFWFAL